MDRMNQVRAIPHTFSRPVRNLSAGVLALTLGLLAVERNTYAAATLVWTNGSDFWQTTAAWTTNGGATGVSPGPTDTTLFTNRSTYYVTLNADATALQIQLQNLANTTQTLTLDLGGNSLTLLQSSASAPTLPIELADAGSSTSILYIASSTAVGKGLFCTNSPGTSGRVLAGRNGVATLFVTNGFVAAIDTRTGNGSTGRGTIVLSGANTYWSNSSTFVVANNAASKLNSLVVSNSASLTVVGVLSIGSAALGASTNSLLLDTGGRLFTRTAGTTIGNGAGTNNTATLQGGARWDLGNRDLTIGGTGPGNSLTIGPNSSVVNVSALTNSASSTLILTGGLVQVSGVVSNFGTLRGFGSIAGNAINLSGGLLTPGFGTAVGAIVVSNNLTLAAGSTTTMKLDKSQTVSNDFLNVFGALAYGGTFTVVTNAGGTLAAGNSYKLFSFGSQSGSFTATNLPSLDPSVRWDTTQLYSQGILAVVVQEVVPGITGPTNQAVNLGSDVIISATVTGVPVPALRWQKDGTNLVGATGNSISLTNVQTSDGGAYCLIASNSVGVATNCMTLTVSGGNVPPVITGPTDQTVVQGNTGTFSISVSGLPTPTLQWLENGTNIVGATGSLLVLTNVQYSQNGFVYSVIASNVAGVVTSSNATLTVIVAPSISAQPQDLVVTNTQSASFSVTASGVPAPGYQWYFNNGIINNATNAIYAIASATPTNAGSYKVVVANAAGSVTSSNAMLTVNSTMTASLTPANGASNVCYDTPLYMVFDRVTVLSGTGKISIYSVTNGVTPVDTIDTSLGVVQSRTIAGESFNTFPIIITGNTVAIYPHLGVLTTNQTYCVAVDAGIFTETNGALFAGITSTNGWVFTTKPTGPANPNNLLVAADGSGDFCTLQGALDSQPNNNTNYTLVNIRNGTYTELVSTRLKNHVTFRGQSRSGTIVRYTNNFNQAPGGSTHSRMSFKVYSDDIAIENVTLINTTPKGGSQAEALMLETNVKRFILNNAEVDSFQDTILGNTSGTQAYFNNSLIQGDTDFIWGGMNAFFTNCEIRCRSTQSHITQARTDAGSNGLSFVNCLLTRSSNTVSNCDLGRDGGAGYPFANAAYIICSMDSQIIPAGWIDGGAASSGTLRFWEYLSTDMTGTNLIDVTSRASWSVQLTNGDARLTLASSATNWLYGWAPQLAPNILGQPTNLTVTAGQTAVFTVSATGIPDPTYQWLKDGTNVVGATGATLTIASALAGDGGVYSVVVSNAAGSVTSGAATLTVVGTAPVAGFTANPTNGVEPLAVTFTDTSSGSPLLSLSWDSGDSTTTNTGGGASFVHIYPAGTYTVTLTASNAFGASAVTQSNLIAVITRFQAWQEQYFGCSVCPQAAPTADPDGDGLDNQTEFLAGTDPTNGLSGLRILSTVPQGNDVVITWTTAGGRTNAVQATAGDANGDYANNFLDISGPIIVLGSGDVTTNLVDQGGATNTPSRYYRVRLVP